MTPLTSGRYGDDNASVSVWKQSVSAWPKPYERNAAMPTRIDAAVPKPVAYDNPAIPVIPETYIRYGRIVTI
jgi:hypothetical protein